MLIAWQAPQIFPPMIPFCSRSSSGLFTPKMPAIAGCFNFSRSPVTCPLLTTLVFTVIFGRLPPDGGASYPLIIIGGLLRQRKPSIAPTIGLKKTFADLI
jgi:hypothetical protein